MAGAVLVFAALYLFTVPEKTGDTPVYADDILRHFQANGSGGDLWEFGHLLWRPLGYGVWRAAHPFLASRFDGNPILEITAVLFALNFLAGIALIPLGYFVCRRLDLRPGPAWAVTTGLVLSATVWNYVHSGASYNPGLALNLAGQLLLLDSLRRGARWGWRAVCAGVLLALSTAIWFPYILSLPAAFLIGWFRPQPPPARDRLRILAVAAAATAGAGLLVFAAGAWENGISSLPLLHHWISNSAHGVQQSRQFVRLPTGITRSFLYLGDDGLLMKRFVFGDPYAPVRWYDLVTAGLWKVALVFAMFAALTLALARRREAWGGLAVLVAGFLPTLLFALFLFETSEPARYETLYPAFLFGVCAVLSLRPAERVARSMLLVFLAATVVVNLYAFGWELKGAAARSTARVHLIESHLQHHGIAFLVSFRDPLSTYLQRDPFVPENRQHALPFYHVIEPAAARVETWRSDAACRVLQAWHEGGEAWLSVRLLAARPKPEWEWVEHDDNRVQWKDLPAFFQRWRTDETIGTTDGFARVTEDSENRALIEGDCHQRF